MIQTNDPIVEAIYALAFSYLLILPYSQERREDFCKGVAAILDAERERIREETMDSVSEWHRP